MALVLKTEDNIDHNSLAKTFTLDNTLSKKHLAMIIVDSKG